MEDNIKQHCPTKFHEFQLTNLQATDFIDNYLIKFEDGSEMRFNGCIVSPQGGILEVYTEHNGYYALYSDGLASFRKVEHAELDYKHPSPLVSFTIVLLLIVQLLIGASCLHLMQQNTDLRGEASLREKYVKSLYMLLEAQNKELQLKP